MKQTRQEQGNRTGNNIKYYFYSSYRLDYIVQQIQYQYEMATITQCVFKSF